MPRRVLSRVVSLWPRLRFGLSSSATAVYWFGLAVLMHVPPGDAPKQPGWFTFPHADKVVHGAMYAVLTALVSFTVWSYRTMRNRTPPGFSRSSARSVVGVVAAYALLDELTQPLTGRNCDPWDFAADVAAALIVVASFRALQPAAAERP